MAQLHNFDASRRAFVTSIVPACAAACFAGTCSVASAQTEDETDNQIVHKFDQKLDRELSYSDYYANHYREFISLTKALEKEWGKDRLIAFLKKNTGERALKHGQKQSQKLGDDSLAAYVKQFRPPKFGKSLTHEIVEDTDTAFQMRVTECIWAKTFRNAEAGDIGYAHICYGDYSWTEGFNSNMKMERDKTLMQGHKYCNHRYVMEG